MTLLDTSLLPISAQKVLSGEAPEKVRQMAARAIVPGLKPADLVTTLVGLCFDADGTLVTAAEQSLSKLPKPAIDSALQSPLQAAVVAKLVKTFRTTTDVVAEHYGLLLQQATITEEAAIDAARHASEMVGEVIATNETLLLRFPGVIEALYMNKRVRMSTADRILELAVRNKLELKLPAYKEASIAILEELISEPTDEPNYDDRLFAETDELARKAELADGDDTHESDDEGEEKLKNEFKPLYARISEMSVTQKIRRAILGTSAERMLLVRETNRLVASAAASSPMLTENEAARIAANRNVIEDVLRIIAQNRSFTRSYQVKLNLVTNPRTPLSFSARMLPHLRDSDLRNIGRSKNVPANIQTLARQQMMRKQKDK